MSQQITIYYFGHLAEMLFRESEFMFLPLTIKDVKSLMAHLARRGEWVNVRTRAPASSSRAAMYLPE